MSQTLSSKTNIPVWLQKVQAVERIRDHPDARKNHSKIGCSNFPFDIIGQEYYFIPCHDIIQADQMTVDEIYKATNFITENCDWNERIHSVLSALEVYGILPVDKMQRKLIWDLQMRGFIFSGPMLDGGGRQRLLAIRTRPLAVTYFIWPDYIGPKTKFTTSWIVFNTWTCEVCWHSAAWLDFIPISTIYFMFLRFWSWMSIVESINRSDNRENQTINQKALSALSYITLWHICCQSVTKQYCYTKKQRLMLESSDQLNDSLKHTGRPTRESCT